VPHADPLVRAAYHRQYHQKNKDSICKKSRDWYAANTQRALIARDLWVKNNPEQSRQIKRRYYEKNRTLTIYRAKKWANDNPELRKIVTHKNKLKKYGMSVQEYGDMLKSQGGSCAICKRRETKRSKGTICKLVVEHHHGNGRIRGLLCNNCNVTLGLVRDDVNVLHEMIQYLRNK